MNNIEKYFFEIFDGLNRLAPGSENTTQAALKLVKNKDANLKILDIGCGVGTQTMILAKEFKNAEIYAIDNHKEYIDILNKKVRDNSLQNRIKPLEMSMFDLKFEKNYFDIILAEGSIYIIGFEKGLVEWSKFLKTNGYLICSEISWTSEPSKEIYDYWMTNYPSINSVKNNNKLAIKHNYKVIDLINFTKEDWTINFYDEVIKKLEIMNNKYKNNDEAYIAINSMNKEIEMYRKYNNEFNYIFYILEK